MSALNYWIIPKEATPTINHDITSWDVSKVSNLTEMFKNTIQLTPENVGKICAGWDLTKITLPESK